MHAGSRTSFIVQLIIKNGFLRGPLSFADIMQTEQHKTSVIHIKCSTLLRLGVYGCARMMKSLNSKDGKYLI